MTKLSGGTTLPIRMDTVNFADFFDYQQVQLTSTTAKYFDDADNFSTFTGTGFTFNASNVPTGGTVNGLTQVVAGSTSLSITEASVAATTVYNYAVAGKTDALLSIVFSGADTLTGTPLRDYLIGYGGNDTLTGGLGADTIDGRAGNDTLEGSQGADQLIGSFGVDTASYKSAATGVTVSLTTPASNTGAAAGDTFQDIENITGGSHNDILTGNQFKNTLSGVGGNDILHGLASGDKLLGGLGNDTLDGGLGQDQQTGGFGQDWFDFNTVFESGLTALTRDILTDFTHAADRIDLSTIDAIPGGANDAFTFRGTLAFSGAGQVRVVQGGANTIVEVNTNADSDVEMTIQLNGIQATSLTGGDFIL
jgi:Ca2+-binding RTX toxin-like protein